MRSAISPRLATRSFTFLLSFRGRRPRNLAFPSATQIFPKGIGPFDQSDLFAPPPTLDLLFSLNSREHIRSRLEENELIDPILGREAGHELLSVFGEPTLQVIGHTCVKGPRTICQDVNEKAAGHLEKRLSRPEQIPRRLLAARDDEE